LYHLTPNPEHHLTPDQEAVT